MSANNDYKLGSRVYSGDDVRAVARATRVEGLQNLSRSQSDGNPYSRSNVGRIIGPGWVVNRRLTAPRRGGRAKRHFPWEISIAGSSSSGSYITLRAGTLNGLLPINMFQQFGISGSGTVYVVLRVFTDGVQPSSASLELESQPPEPPPHFVNVAPAAFPILIGLTVDLKPFNTVDGLLEATPKVVLKTTVSNPSPGTPLYDLHWSWSVTQY